MIVRYIWSVFVAGVTASLVLAAPAVADEPADTQPPGPTINAVEPPSTPYDQSGGCEFSAGDGFGAACASEPTDTLIDGFLY